MCRREPIIPADHTTITTTGIMAITTITEDITNIVITIIRAANTIKVVMAVENATSRCGSKLCSSV